MIKLVTLLSKKPGMSREAFIAHYETHHRLIGEKYLKSNLFTVKLDRDQVKFEGYGEGHGVGLCLYSANEMSKKGATVEQILLDFFPNTLLQEVKKLDFSKDGLDDF